MATPDARGADLLIFGCVVGWGCIGSSCCLNQSLGPLQTVTIPILIGTFNVHVGRAWRVEGRRSATLYVNSWLSLDHLVGFYVALGLSVITMGTARCDLSGRVHCSNPSSR
ncbi:hypothetical protein ACXX9E_29475 [Pseudomonas sp. GNP014]